MLGKNFPSQNSRQDPPSPNQNNQCNNPAINWQSSSQARKQQGEQATNQPVAPVMIIAPMTLYGSSLKMGVRNSSTHITIMLVTKPDRGVLAPQLLLMALRLKLPVVV
jgi:hypothetical protein